MQIIFENTIIMIHKFALVHMCNVLHRLLADDENGKKLSCDGIAI